MSAPLFANPFSTFYSQVELKSFTTGNISDQSFFCLKYFTLNRNEKTACATDYWGTAYKSYKSLYKTAQLAHMLNSNIRIYVKEKSISKSEISSAFGDKGVYTDEIVAIMIE